MKKVIIIGLAIILAILGWHYRFSIEKFLNKKFPALAQSPLVQDIKQDISAPPPLVSNIFSPTAHLTVEGTIQQTNFNRQENGNLPALKENTLLDKAAQLKLTDMFKQQYFEHVNPQGVGPADLAKEVGYNFLSEGENLALGNFQDDKALVTAWMNSPGHRANILNIHYTEIGVAVGQGLYQGKETWLAVQEFGRPAADCPSVNTSLKSQITTDQAEINSLQSQLNAEKAQIDAMDPHSQSQYDAYNQALQQYNEQVDIYNNKVDSLKQIVNEYNSEVNTYNTCLTS